MKHKIAIALSILLTLTSCANMNAQKEKTTQSPILTEKGTTESGDSIPYVSKDLLLGRFDPKNDSNFTLVDAKYCDKVMYLNKEAYAAFKKMYYAAKKDGITLTIVSGTRNFEYQKRIWDRKWKNFTGTDSAKVKKIMEYSSMPGTSRHHWGSDMDLISVETEDWIQGGKCFKAFQWLKANAHKFGFFQPYTDDPNRGGYCEERWHWSYAPLSESYLKAYEKYITEDDIYGFDGSEYAKKFGVIKTHVMGITPKEGYKK